MPTKRPLICIRDIVENGQSVLDYTAGMDFDAYLNSRITRDACERCLARISEASVKLGTIAEELFPDHNWPAIRGIGNMLRHEYENILDETLWAIITRHLPPPAERTQNLSRPLSAGSGNAVRSATPKR